MLFSWPAEKNKNPPGLQPEAPGALCKGTMKLLPLLPSPAPSRAAACRCCQHPGSFWPWPMGDQRPLVLPTRIRTSPSLMVTKSNTDDDKPLRWDRLFYEACRLQETASRQQLGWFWRGTIKKIIKKKKKEAARILFSPCIWRRQMRTNIPAYSYRARSIILNLRRIAHRSGSVIIVNISNASNLICSGLQWIISWLSLVFFTTMKQHKLCVSCKNMKTFIDGNQTTFFSPTVSLIC